MRMFSESPIDITERKQLEDQLRQSQKIEAIGQLAGGIAHDFNNLLNGVLGYAGLLMHHHGQNPDIAKIAEKIEYAGQRAQQLTEKLVGFARQGKHQNIPVDLHSSIEETVSLLQRTFETNIEVQQDLYKENVFALGDPVQIQQIILNLSINARDAMSPEAGGSNGGVLRVSTNIEDILPSTPVLGRELSPGKYIVLEVTDTGCGIPDEITSKIFDPFFTTKRQGKGTGMGLSMVYGIVQNHGGSIRVKSSVDTGTTFSVYLPAVESPDVPVNLTRSDSSIPGQGTILLVDDDEVTREVTSDMLETLGYTVVRAKDGLEAVEYYRSAHAGIDLLILDMVMPKLGGGDCFKKCLSINPQVKAILTTGYDNNHSVQSVLNQGMIGFLQKPFSLEDLSREVSRACTLDVTREQEVANS